MLTDEAAVQALDRAVEKVETQRRVIALLPLNDPRRLDETAVLETLRQGAALARMACLFLLSDELLEAHETCIHSALPVQKSETEPLV